MESSSNFKTLYIIFTRFSLIKCERNVFVLS